MPVDLACRHPSASRAWLTTTGEPRCARCHPPADPAHVRWVEPAVAPSPEAVARLAPLLLQWWAFVACEAEGAPPPASVVAVTHRRIRAAWTDLGDAGAEAVYRQAAADYRQETMSCPLCGAHVAVDRCAEEGAP